MQCWMKAAALGLMCFAIPQLSQAYWVYDSRWANAEATFIAALTNKDGTHAPVSGQSWDSAFSEAMSSWNASTSFQFSMVNSPSNPCSTFDWENGAMFSDSICEDAFGSNTLAVTTFETNGPIRTEADIIFNDQFAWDIYEGPLSPVSPDFRRIAVHELGHAIGLGHEFDLPAIMNTEISDIEAPLLDDIEGVEALYGGCEIVSPITIGDPLVAMHLEAADCLGSELGIFSQNSLLDQYVFTVAHPGVFTVSLVPGFESYVYEIAEFDGYLMLFDESLTSLITSDDDSYTPWLPEHDSVYAKTNPMITIPLDAGNYTLIATSYFEFEEGVYRLDTLFVPEPGHCLLQLVAIGALTGLARHRRGRPKLAERMG